MTLRQLYDSTPLELKKILFNQFQVTVDRTPVWPVDPSTIELAPQQSSIF